MSNVEVISFFHQDSCTFTYLVIDASTGAAAIIDSVMDFDLASGTLSTDSADQILHQVKQRNLEVQWILETHVHADHLSAAPYLCKVTGAKLAIGNQIRQIQETFANVFNPGTDFARDGSQFDVLFADQTSFKVGSVEASALYTPGHTPACMTYLIGDAVFVGDTLFMPDYGSARCDFPGGDAQQLYQSVQKIYQLPDSTRMFLCHDYLTGSRTEYQCQCSVGEQRRSNIHLHQGISETEFIQMRTARDAKLSMPKLILPSVQVNMRAGHLPATEDDGRHYLKIPVNAFLSE